MAFSEEKESTTIGRHPDAGAGGASSGPAQHVEPSAVEAAYATVQRMVSPGGCAWHEVQTHESLVPFLIEETAEFVDAVERGLAAEEIAGELGDVLYQVLFHAAIAERDSEGFDLGSVAELLNEKLIARHPHVFGDRGYMTVEELHAEWERLKEDAAGEQRGSRSALEGIPVGMPTLARSAKVVERLKRAKLLEVNASRSPEFRPDATASETLEVNASRSPEFRPDATASETLEVNASREPSGAGEAVDAAERHLGDAMLDLVIQANAAGVDPDRALRLATARLAERLGA